MTPKSPVDSLLRIASDLSNKGNGVEGPMDAVQSIREILLGLTTPVGTTQIAYQ